MKTQTRGLFDHIDAAAQLRDPFLPLAAGDLHRGRRHFRGLKRFTLGLTSLGRNLVIAFRLGIGRNLPIVPILGLGRLVVRVPRLGMRGLYVVMIPPLTGPVGRGR